MLSLKACLAVFLLGDAAANSGIRAPYHDEWAALRPELDANIERYRKSDCLIQLVDAEGRPVTDATIAVSQTSHDFVFGCNILLLGQLDDQNDEYEKAFVKLFNLATTTFTWLDYEPQPGQLRFADDSPEVWRRPPPDRVVAFGKKHDLRIKGQPLLCNHWTPQWASTDPERLKDQYREWFTNVSARYGNDFTIFDVVNESLWDRPFALHTPDLAYVHWAFAQAQKFFPKGALLELNESTPVHDFWQDRYYKLVEDLVEKEAGVESIGIQFHLTHADRYGGYQRGERFSPRSMLKTYERFSAFELPLYITEVTVPATFTPGYEGERIQAELVTNLYRLWFSVPKMAGITYWNLPDGAAWKQEGLVKGGLLDEYMREKPAYQALYQLIKREWNTQMRLQPDAKGESVMRGFHGRYSVTVQRVGETREFSFYLSAGLTSPVRLAWQ